MPPGMPWAYGQSMSMRNPMSRAPMNNNPMGVQAPMTPNYGAASGAAATFQPLPYAGRALGAAGPASAVGGMVAGQSAMSRPAPRPQSTPYMRAMSGNPIYGQNGIGVQRAAQNVLMGQPMDADTRMRGLNMPGMQFNPSRGAMAQNQRTPLTVNPDQQRWGRMNNPSIGGGAPIDGATQRANTRIARAGRMAGVRAGDMAQWRATSPAALAIARNAMPQLQHPGPPGNVPAQMGEQVAASGGSIAVGPPVAATGTTTQADANPFLQEEINRNQRAEAISAQQVDPSSSWSMLTGGISNTLSAIGMVNRNQIYDQTVGYQSLMPGRLDVSKGNMLNFGIAPIRNDGQPGDPAPGAVRPPLNLNQSETVGPDAKSGVYRLPKNWRGKR